MDRHVVEKRLNQTVLCLWPLEELKVYLKTVVFVAHAVNNQIVRLVLEAVAFRVTHITTLCKHCYEQN